MSNKTLTIATWNVNGVRARLDRVLAWLNRNPVDVLCLQETKVQDSQFPSEPFETIGYRIAMHGQKSFNGVALLSRIPMDGVEQGLGDDPQARLLSATVAGIRVYSAYFPNGQAVGSEKYEYKLRWMGWLRDRLEADGTMYPRIALCGDFNVAPEERDTHDPLVWEGNILCSEKEREALRALRRLGLHDGLREVRPDDVVFTWWDYRALGFPKNHGLRIDHVYVSTSLRDCLTGVVVDREERKGKQASDHAPVIATLEPYQEWDSLPTQK